MRSPTNCYLVSLAFADLLLLLSAAVPTIAEYYLIVDQFIFGALACSVMVFCQYLGFNLSSLSITALTAERYVAICQPMKAQSLCTVGRAKKIIAVLWLFGFCYSAPWLGLATTRAKKGDEEIEQCTFTLDRRQYLAYYMADLLVMYLTPVVVNAVLYAFIANTLYKSNPASLASGPFGMQTTTAVNATTTSSRSTSQSSKTSRVSSCKNILKAKGVLDCNHPIGDGIKPITYYDVEVQPKAEVKRKLRFNLSNMKQNLLHPAEGSTKHLMLSNLSEIRDDDSILLKRENDKSTKKHQCDSRRNSRKDSREQSKDSTSSPGAKSQRKKRGAEVYRGSKHAPLKENTSPSMIHESRSLEHLGMFRRSFIATTGQSASDENIKGEAHRRAFLKAENKAGSDLQPGRGDELPNVSRTLPLPSSSSSSSSPSVESTTKYRKRSCDFDFKVTKNNPNAALSDEDQISSGNEIFQVNLPNSTYTSSTLPSTLAILTTPACSSTGRQLTLKARRLSKSVPFMAIPEGVKGAERVGTSSGFWSVGSRMNLAASTILNKDKSKVTFSLSSSSASSNHNFSTRLQVVTC